MIKQGQKLGDGADADAGLIHAAHHDLQTQLARAAHVQNGARLGAEAAGDVGLAVPVPAIPAASSEEAVSSEPLWWVHGGKDAAFVDVQNDVATKDIELARLEGYGASEHVKRYTTLGMGTDQGKTANVVALGVLSELTGAPRCK